MSLFLLSPVTAGQCLLISSEDSIFTGVTKLLGGGLLLLGLGSGRDAIRLALKEGEIFPVEDLDIERSSTKMMPEKITHESMVPFT